MKKTGSDIVVDAHATEVLTKSKQSIGTSLPYNSKKAAIESDLSLLFCLQAMLTVCKREILRLKYRSKNGYSHPLEAPQFAIFHNLLIFSKKKIWRKFFCDFLTCSGDCLLLFIYKGSFLRAKKTRTKIWRKMGMEKRVTEVYDVDFNRWGNEMQRAHELSIVQPTCEKIFLNLVNFLQSSDIQSINDFDGLFKKNLFFKKMRFARENAQGWLCLLVLGGQM